MDIKYSKQASDEMIKKVVLAWDPDFTKLTPAEKKRMEQAERELENGEFLTHNEVWGDIQ